MRARSVLFSLLLVIGFVGFVTVGITHAALDFVDWSGTWFTVKVSGTGKAGPVVPPGGTLVTNNISTTTAYLLVDTWEAAAGTYDVVYCTFNGSVWTRHTGFEWPVWGGPENFLTLFFLEYEEPQGTTQTFVIPLNVTGKEKPNTAGEINSASFKNLGGLFLQESVDEAGMGSAKFTGSFIKPAQVVDKVPAGCRVP
jgi:hypothetical protein